MLAFTITIRPYDQQAGVLSLVREVFGDVLLVLDKVNGAFV